MYLLFIRNAILTTVFQLIMLKLPFLVHASVNSELRAFQYLVHCFSLFLFLLHLYSPLITATIIVYILANAESATGIQNSSANENIIVRPQLFLIQSYVSRSRELQEINLDTPEPTMYSNSMTSSNLLHSTPKASATYQQLHNIFHEH